MKKGKRKWRKEEERKKVKKERRNDRQQEVRREVRTEKEEAERMRGEGYGWRHPGTEKKR